MRWLGLLGMCSVCLIDDGMLIFCSVLCSEMAVKLVDEPFVSATDNLEEWAL